MQATPTLAALPRAGGLLRDRALAALAEGAQHGTEPWLICSLGGRAESPPGQRPPCCLSPLGSLSVQAKG